LAVVKVRARVRRDVNGFGEMGQPEADGHAILFWHSVIFVSFLFRRIPNEIH